MRNQAATIAGFLRSLPRIVVPRALLVETPLLALLQPIGPLDAVTRAQKVTIIKTELMGSMRAAAEKTGKSEKQN